MKKFSLVLAAFLAIGTVSLAKEVVAAPVEPVTLEERSETTPISKDFKFVNFSLMHGNRMTAFGPRINDTFLEVEIGGRKGAFDFYGYIDISDIFQNEKFSDANKNSDKSGNANFFTEMMPRLSMNEMFNADLSLGAIKEVYLAGYLKAGDDGGVLYAGEGDPANGSPMNGLFVYGLGLGTDIEVPWLGTMGLNAYALYVAEDFGSNREGKWDGYLVKNNWFKPFYFFENGTFLSYQGYMAYQFDAGYEDTTMRSSDEFQWFNGLYWHGDNYSLGYGLKYTKDMIAAKDGAYNFGGQKISSTGFSNFFAVTYKF